MNESRPATVFCIDGSGNKDQKAADRKRPIYQLNVSSGTISRPLLAGGESVYQFFSRQIYSEAVTKPMLIAADLPIGLPTQPPDVYQAVGVETFLQWLIATQKRRATDRQTWRDGLIAAGVAQRSALRPFVSIQKGDDITRVRAKRECDTQSGAESVYCVDHGGKQVGRAALQFWFEVLVPLREQFKGRVAVWPFEPLAGADVIVAECYPAECQRMVYGAMVKKRQPLEVAKALICSSCPIAKEDNCHARENATCRQLRRNREGWNCPGGLGMSNGVAAGAAIILHNAAGAILKYASRGGAMAGRPWIIDVTDCHHDRSPAQRDADRGLAAGMDAYLSKPINGHELIALVEQLSTSAPRPRQMPCGGWSSWPGPAS